jgi:hypothetical protein
MKYFTKQAARAIDLFLRAKEIGVHAVPGTGWKRLVQNSKGLEGRQLQEYLQNQGKVPNNTYQAISSKVRKISGGSTPGEKYVTGTEISGVLDIKGNIKGEVIVGPFKEGYASSPKYNNPKVIRSFHNHPTDGMNKHKKKMKDYLRYAKSPNFINEYKNEYIDPWNLKYYREFYQRFGNKNPELARASWGDSDVFYSANKQMDRKTLSKAKDNIFTPEHGYEGVHATVPNMTEPFVDYNTKSIYFDRRPRKIRQEEVAQLRAKLKQ